VDVVIAPTTLPAWKTDLVNSDNFKGSSSSLSAIVDTTHITPVGKVRGLPVGLSIIANKNQPQLAYAHAQIIDAVFISPIKKPE